MLLNGKPDISRGPCNLSTTQPGLDNAPTLFFGATPAALPAALSPCRHSPTDTRRPHRREQTSQDRNNDNKDTRAEAATHRGELHTWPELGALGPPEHSPTPVTARKPRPLRGDGHWLSRGTRQGRLGRQHGEEWGPPTPDSQAPKVRDPGLGHWSLALLCFCTVPTPTFLGAGRASP